MNGADSNDPTALRPDRRRAFARSTLTFGCRKSPVRWIGALSTARTPACGIAKSVKAIRRFARSIHP